MALRLYITGEFWQKKKISPRIQQLERLGHRVTYDWTHKARGFISKSLRGLKKAEIVIVCFDFESEKPRENTKIWFEIGIAVSKKKEIAVIGSGLKSSELLSGYDQLNTFSEWDDLLYWIFDQSRIKNERLALRFLSASCFMEKTLSIKWIGQMLEHGRKTISKPENEGWWAHNPPLDLVLIKSSKCKDYPVEAIGLDSRGFSLSEDKLFLDVILEGEIFYFEFEFNPRNKYWVESTPELNTGTYYLKFYKKSFRNHEYGLVSVETSKYDNMPSIPIYMGDHRSPL